MGRYSIQKKIENRSAAGWYCEKRRPPAALWERAAGRCAERIRCARQREEGKPRQNSSLASLGSEFCLTQCKRFDDRLLCQLQPRTARGKIALLAGPTKGRRYQTHCDRTGSACGHAPRTTALHNDGSTRRRACPARERAVRSGFNRAAQTSRPAHLAAVQLAAVCQSSYMRCHSFFLPCRPKYACTK